MKRIEDRQLARLGSVKDLQAAKKKGEPCDTRNGGECEG